MADKNAAALPNVPLLDLERENGPLLAELEEAACQVLRSGRFVFGPDCTQLEQEVAELCSVKHAVGCASGSDALLLALMACDVGPDDEVIVPSFTFFATVSAPWRLGAKVVFADIDPQTFNIDPASVDEAVTPKTKAVIPVHLFGQCAAMDEICTLAQPRGIAVIEDAAQAISAKHRDRPAGGLGDVGCFSFYPTKNLGGCGDGGMLTAGDDALADKLRRLRNHGMEPRYYHDDVGINSRLDSLQAAALRVKLPHLAKWTNQRRANAARYVELFKQHRIEEAVVLPVEEPDCHHVWNQYTIRVRDGQRDALRTHLQSAGVGSEIYYPVPAHGQKCFARLAYGPGSLPHTEKAATEVLSLPIFPQLTAAEQERVVQSIAGFFAGSKKSAA